MRGRFTVRPQWVVGECPSCGAIGNAAPSCRDSWVKRVTRIRRQQHRNEGTQALSNRRKTKTTPGWAAGAKRATQNLPVASKLEATEGRIEPRYKPRRWAVGAFLAVCAVVVTVAVASGRFVPFIRQPFELIALARVFVLIEGAALFFFLDHAVMDTTVPDRTDAAVSLSWIYQPALAWSLIGIGVLFSAMRSTVRTMDRAERRVDNGSLWRSGRSGMAGEPTGT
jgi:hypothetical protein